MYSSHCDRLVCNETVNGMICECVRNPVDPTIRTAACVLLVVFLIILIVLVMGGKK